jgi:biotin carboxyl carrier protein
MIEVKLNDDVWDGLEDGTEALLQSWSVSVGDRVQQGSELGIAELVKTTLAVEAPHSGVVAEILVSAEQTFGRGAVLLVIDDKS